MCMFSLVCCSVSWVCAVLLHSRLDLTTDLILYLHSLCGFDSVLCMWCVGVKRRGYDEVEGNAHFQYGVVLTSLMSAPAS